MFKHALTHDRGLPHAAAGAAQGAASHRGSGHRGGSPEQYETLAYHYAQGKAWPKALQYLDLAGEKATAAYANQDALEFYAQALDVSTAG